MSLQTLDCGSKISLIVISANCPIEFRRSDSGKTFVRFNSSEVKVANNPETLTIKSLSKQRHGSISQSNSGVMNGGMFASIGSETNNADTIIVWTDPNIVTNIVRSAGVDLLFETTSMN